MKPINTQQIFLKEKENVHTNGCQTDVCFEKTYKLLMNINPVFTSKKIWINVGTVGETVSFIEAWRKDIPSGLYSFMKCPYFALT